MKRAQPPHLIEGRAAETRACEHLIRHGLRPVERNFRSPFGEIDLVMEDRDTVVFVEVRYRNTSRFGGPTESIDFRKRGRLRATAEYYLQRNRRLAKRPCRFDVVALTAGKNEVRLQWIQNAFET